jgi:hypothetical protein
MDTRGRGGGWGTGGVTPDLDGRGPATPGFLTRLADVGAGHLPPEPDTSGGQAPGG